MAPKGMALYLFWSEIGYQFWPFRAQIEYGFALCMFFEKVTSSSLSIRPSTIALHNVFNIRLNKGTNYEAGLEQGNDYSHSQGGRPS